MRAYKARGIVLHTVKYGDSGMIAYILTDTGGRQNFMVQGVKSSRGRGSKASLLQPMFLLEMECTESPHAQMHRIREMRSDPVLRSIPFDVRKSAVALFMAEMLYRLVREVEPNSPLFDFVHRTVVTLDELQDSLAVANFHLWFMVGLSRFLGIFPAGEWIQGSWFDFREGVFTAHQPLHGYNFSRENSEILGRLMDVEFSPATLSLNRAKRSDFLNAMLAYFGYHLDAVRDIRSVDILREVF